MASSTRLRANKALGARQNAGTDRRSLEAQSPRPQQEAAGDAPEQKRPLQKEDTYRERLITI